MNSKELQVLQLPKSEGESWHPTVIGFLRGVTVYWSMPIYESSISALKISKVVRVVIYIFLGLVAAGGLAAGVYGLVFQFSFNLSSLFTAPSVWLRVFWITVFFDMFLIYLVMLRSGMKKAVMQKTYEEEVVMPPTLQQWSDVKSLRASQRRRVELACSDEALELVSQAYRLAKKYKHAEVNELHLILAGIGFTGEGQHLIARLGIDGRGFVERLIRLAPNFQFDENSTEFGPTAQKLMIKAYKNSHEHRMDSVTPVEIMEVSILSNDNILEALYDMGIESEDVANAVEWLRINKRLRERYQRYRAAGRLRSKSGIDRAMTAVATQYLNRLSQDLTRLAQLGYLDLTIDREREVEEIFRIFQTGSRNVLLVGKPGVGKKAIVEGLAERIVGDDVPGFLREKRVVSLSISKLVAGAGMGEVQERLLMAVSEAVRAGNVILFIDNLHDIVGITASGEMGLDLTDVLGEVLQKNLIYFIATTDEINYSRAIERSSIGTIMRPVKIAEMDQQQTVQVLESKVGFIENKQNVYFSYEALKKIAAHTDRYMHDAYLPHKAIAVMEEVAVYVRSRMGDGATVSGQDVAALLTEKLGIPITDVAADEGQKLLNLEQTLHERVIGQDEAVSAVATALRRARAELRDIRRPIANLLFLGPTGVGKTELSKAIAEVYFGSEDNMVRLDMSEYQNQADLYKMIGSPPGTGGSQQGQLTEAIRKNPYTIVLLDELEKAHPDILNVFLQVMEDGRLTDASGHTVDFTNSIIISTSNAGTSYIQEQVMQGADLTSIKQHLLETELAQNFRPEFLNRFDNIIVFKPLTQDDVVKIAHLLLRRVASNLETKGITLRATDEAVEELAVKGFDPLYGARPLRRLIQDQVDNALADALLRGEIGRRDVVVLEKGGDIRIEKAKVL